MREEVRCVECNVPCRCCDSIQHEWTACCVQDYTRRSRTCFSSHTASTGLAEESGSDGFLAGLDLQASQLHCWNGPVSIGQRCPYGARAGPLCSSKQPPNATESYTVIVEAVSEERVTVEPMGIRVYRNCKIHIISHLHTSISNLTTPPQTPKNDPPTPIFQNKNAPPHHHRLSRDVHVQLRRGRHQQPPSPPYPCRCTTKISPNICQQPNRPQHLHLHNLPSHLYSHLKYSAAMTAFAPTLTSGAKQ